MYNTMIKLNNLQLQLLMDIDSIIDDYKDRLYIKYNSPILAAAVLESMWGQSKLAMEYNNYFSLRVIPTWSGKSYDPDTQEVIPSDSMLPITDNYCIYKSMEDCLIDYMQRIVKSHPEIITCKSIKEFVRIAYGEQPIYMKNIIKVMDDFNLYIYDEYYDEPAPKKAEPPKKPVTPSPVKKEEPKKAEPPKKPTPPPPVKKEEVKKEEPKKPVTPPPVKKEEPKKAELPKPTPSPVKKEEVKKVEPDKAESPKIQEIKDEPPKVPAPKPFMRQRSAIPTTVISQEEVKVKKEEIKKQEEATPIKEKDADMETSKIVINDGTGSVSSGHASTTTSILHNTHTGKNKTAKDNNVYTVKEGEDLKTVSYNLGISKFVLIDLNHLTPPYTISAGDILTLPANVTPFTYTVKATDTIQSIAAVYGLKWQDIARINNITYPYKIKAGTEINLK